MNIQRLQEIKDELEKYHSELDGWTFTSVNDQGMIETHCVKDDVGLACDAMADLISVMEMAEGIE